jgi:hypothetical protein
MMNLRAEKGAENLVARESLKITKLCDRTFAAITLDEVERIAI